MLLLSIRTPGSSFYSSVVGCYNGAGECHPSTHDFYFHYYYYYYHTVPLRLLPSFEVFFCLVGNDGSDSGDSDEVSGVDDGDGNNVDGTGHSDTNTNSNTFVARQ